ncbi:MAG: TolC family protein [Hungatella sp.]|nr:TolC family protein [Hungatella sp.]
MMRGCKRALALGLTGILTLSVPFGAMAAIEKPEKMDDATWARLQDNVLEYDEISDLVEYYNPTYRQIVEQIEINAQPMEEAARELRKSADEMDSDAKDIKDLDPVMYKGMREAVKGYRDAAERFDKAVTSVHNQTRHQLSRVKKMTVSGLQQMMIGYYQAMASREILDTAVALSQAAYESSITQQSLGMATATDVQAAEKALQSARGQLKTLDDTMTNLRQQMCVMTGWSYDADMQLGDVPAPDFAKVQAMDLERDLERAIGNNYTLIEQRGISGKGDANRTAKFRIMDDTEAQVKIQLESAYQGILESRTAYEAANVAFQSAQITMNGNDLKYQMGMLGNLEYLQLKMAYLQQKAAARTAALSLTQAIENYGWIVQGLEGQSAN